MRLNRFLTALFVAGLFVGCGSDDNGGGAAADPNAGLTTLSVGAGENCANITGTYQCTTVSSNNNTTTRNMTFGFSTDSQNRQVLQVNSDSLVADGTIYTRGSTNYVVNCSGNSVSYHLKYNDNFYAKTTLTLDASNGLTERVQSYVDGEVTDNRGTCTLVNNNNNIFGNNGTSTTTGNFLNDLNGLVSDFLLDWSSEAISNLNLFNNNQNKQ
ncbi:MAG: hypothetical protein HRT44_09660 [Bdellovibrionales bacterium]|nr:hypothetical protein [Bdellovibrionales bacterium]NQZ19505.1 hypothetical protein [Bdellovibrionales bacterium]